MSTYNSDMIEYGINENKLIPSISINTKTNSKYYQTLYNVTSWGTKTITTWFKPKVIHIRTVFEDQFAASSSFSLTYSVVNEDDTVTVSWIHSDSSQLSTLWTWDSSSIYAVYLDANHYFYINSINDTWFTLNWVFTWDDWYLYITVFW